MLISKKHMGTLTFIRSEKDQKVYVFEAFNQVQISMGWDTQDVAWDDPSWAGGAAAGKLFCLPSCYLFSFRWKWFGAFVPTSSKKKKNFDPSFPSLICYRMDFFFFWVKLSNGIITMINFWCYCSNYLVINAAIILFQF